MRFMMLMIPKGYEKAERRAPCRTPKAVAAMMKYNEALQKAGVLLALDGLHPPSMGARVSFSGRQAQGDRRAVHRGQGGDRRLLDDPGEVEGGGHRVGVALPRVGQRSDRGPPGAGDARTSPPTCRRPRPDSTRCSRSPASARVVTP